jgi:hypothetical protein
MSEIKFACPHCSQHIACDDLYCGERIDCPGCEWEMFIPPRAAFVPLQAGNMTLTLPVAFKERSHPRSASLDFSSKNRRPQRASESRDHQQPSSLPLWILLLLPFVLAFILMTHRGGVASMEYGFILCALLSGFYFAKINGFSGLGLVLVGLLCSFAMIFVYIILSFGLLFVGCLVAISR